MEVEKVVTHAKACGVFLLLHHHTMGVMAVARTRKRRPLSARSSHTQQLLFSRQLTKMTRERGVYPL